MALFQRSALGTKLTKETMRILTTLQKRELTIARAVVELHNEKNTDSQVGIHAGVVYSVAGIQNIPEHHKAQPTKICFIHRQV